MVTPVTIVIPAYNQLDCCRQCIESIRAHTDYPHKLVLIDNGSTDGVSEYFDSVPGAVVVHSETNVGFPAGVNLGLAHAEGHVLLLNSDTIVPERWLDRLIAALERAPRIGVVGPMSNCVSGPQLVPDLHFGSIAEINAFAGARAERYRGILVDAERVVGFCMVIRDAAFAAVGTLDESFGIGNFEDDDYCLRVRRAGYRVCIAEDCFVFHYGSRTFAAMGFDHAGFNALIARNEAAFNRKWGTRPGASRVDRVAEGLLAEARALESEGKFAAAVAKIRDAVAMAPHFAPAYCQLGAVLLEMDCRPQ
ncbi:MAG: glycosyltransferase family 2 protein, partial [Candidatus Hydrogenedentes bacterium]|nr:glycosyltransferase family 2 protein [Candidatus Hydrogenedentota bacterium]